MTLLLALIAALGFGVSDFVGGLAARTEQVLRVVLVSYPVGLIGMLLIAPFLSGHLDLAGLVYGTLSGLAVGGAVVLYYLALATGPMSVVSPLTALLVAGLPLGFGLLSGERPGTIALVGAGLALVAVVLVSREERSTLDEGTPRFTRKVAWLTIASGVAFAAYFVLLDRVGHDTGLWPLVVGRLASTMTIAIVAGVSGHLRLAARVPLRLALAAGALDVVANATFVYALREGLLSLVSVVTALYPAATVLLARLLLGERTGRVQQVGLVLAAASVAMIAGAS